MGEFNPDDIAKLSARMSPANVDFAALDIPRRRTTTAPAADAAARMLAVLPAKYAPCAERAEAARRMKFSPEPVFDAALGIFAGTVRRVTLHGVSAAGKTSASALIVGELARLVVAHYATAAKDPAGRPLSFWNYAIAWCEAHDLAMEADFSDPKDGEPDLARRMRTAPIVVLDDLGNERGRFAGSNNVPAGTLQSRYAADLCTITTTGLSSADLIARYGIGVARRLSDIQDPTNRLIGPEKRAK